MESDKAAAKPVAIPVSFPANADNLMQVGFENYPAAQVSPIPIRSPRLEKRFIECCEKV